ITLLVAGSDRARLRANYRVLIREIARMDATVPVSLTGGDVPPGHTERREMLAAAARQLEAKRSDPAIAKARDQQQKRVDKAGEVARADDLLAEVRRRQERAEKLTDLAEGLVGRAAADRDWRTAIAGVQSAVSASREVRECLALLGRLSGELDERPQINVLVA